MGSASKEEKLTKSASPMADRNEREQTPSSKTFAFWTLVGLLSLLAWGNMILTIVIYSVLRLGNGMESMELVPIESTVKFYGDADLGDVFKPDGKIEGVENTDSEIRGVKGPVVLEVEDRKGHVRNSLAMEQNGTLVKGVRNFEVDRIFQTESPNFKLLKAVRNVQTKLAHLGRVTGPVEEKLVLRSDSYTKLKGSEGTRIEGKEIVWSADQEVKLRSVNGSIILSGKGGITLDVKKIPIVSKGLGGIQTSQYKVCVCMPQGRLFRVPVSKDFNSQVACHNIDVGQFNPCA